MNEDNKAGDERGTRGQCMLARRLTLACWCRKGILGMAALELKVVELMAKHMHSSSGDSTSP